MRFDDDTWRTGKAEITVLLQETARMRGTITYSDLSKRLQTIVIPYDDPAMATMLDEVSSEEFAAGRGMLSAVVIHKHGDQLPGPGFFKLAESLGCAVIDRTSFWVSELQTVHTYWSNHLQSKH